MYIYICVYRVVRMHMLEILLLSGTDPVCGVSFDTMLKLSGDPDARPLHVSTPPPLSLYFYNPKRGDVPEAHC